MGFQEFLGNERIVTALRGALRTKRVPHALLFTGAPGVGKFTLARMFAQAANCERLPDDFCGECATCQRISRLSDLQSLLEQGLAERGESADAATVERVPLILQSHPDVWALVPDPVRLKSPDAQHRARDGTLQADRIGHERPHVRVRLENQRHALDGGGVSALATFGEALLEQRLQIGEPGDALTSSALAAEVVGEAFAIGGLRKHAGEGEFANAARAGEEQCVGNTFSAESAAERRDDTFVAEKLLKTHD